MCDKICQGHLTNVNRLGSDIMQRDTRNGRRANKWEIRRKGEGIYLGGGRSIALLGRSQFAPSRPSDRSRMQVMRNSCLIRGP